MSKPGEIIDVSSTDTDSLLVFQSESEDKAGAPVAPRRRRILRRPRIPRIGAGVVVARARRGWAALESAISVFGGHCVTCLKSERARREVLRWSPQLAIFVLGIGVGALVTAHDTNPDHATRVTSDEPVESRPSSVIAPASQESAAPTATTGSTRPSIASGASSWPPKVDQVRPAADGPRPRGHRGTLIVTSRPLGARVYLNNRFAGHTPLSMRAQPVGSRAVRLTLDGYANWSRAITIVANRATNVSAQLTRSE